MKINRNIQRLLKKYKFGKDYQTKKANQMEIKGERIRKGR